MSLLTENPPFHFFVDEVTVFVEGDKSCFGLPCFLADILSL
jgi:hypothetical protein